MKHIMVDLETWGTTPGSDIRSIGAVVFDPTEGALGDEFYVNIRSVPSNYGLTRDPATIKWWTEQSVEAKLRLLDNQVGLYSALAQFASWWEAMTLYAEPRGVSPTFWAHGPQFDEAILAACYRAVGHPVPWHYRAPRDTRTIYAAAGGIDLPFEGTEHNALHDAKHQARCVIAAYRTLGLCNDLPIEIDSEEEGFMLEAAHQVGFEFSNDDASRYRCTQSQIIDLMKRAVECGKLRANKTHDHRVTELLQANNREVERRRAAEQRVSDLELAAANHRKAEAAYIADLGNVQRYEAVGVAAAMLDVVLANGKDS